MEELSPLEIKVHRVDSLQPDCVLLNPFSTEVLQISE
jgi:hypothetical protein